jgi:hypothetical protein
MPEIVSENISTYALHYICHKQAHSFWGMFSNSSFSPLHISSRYFYVCKYTVYVCYKLLMEIVLSFIIISNNAALTPVIYTSLHACISPVQEIFPSFYLNNSFWFNIFLLVLGIIKLLILCQTGRWMRMCCCLYI